MITPELLGYIRAELAKGRSREAIHNDLIHGGGWMTSDVDEAFREITPPPAPVPKAPEPVVPPVQPQPTFQQPAPQPFSQFQPQPQFHPEPQPVVMVQPVAVVQPVIEVAQSAAAPQPIVEQPMQKKRPYLLHGFLMVLLSVVIVLIGAASTASWQAKLASISTVQSMTGFLIPLVLIVEFVFAIILTLGLHLATKIIKGITPSWHKAFFATGLSMVIGAISLLIRAYIPTVGLVSVLLFIFLFGIQITVLARTYAIRSTKAFFVGLIQGILFMIILFLIGVIVGVTSGPISSHTNQAVPNTPSKALLFQQ